MSEKDLKTLVLEFKTSVSADLDAQHRRLDAFADEMRDSLHQMRDGLDLARQEARTAQTAVINEIRAFGSRFDRRLERIEKSDRGE